MLEADVAAGRTGSLLEYTAFVVSAAERLDSLITALLSYSGVGRDDAELEIVDCRVLLDDVVGDLQVDLDEAGGAVTIGPMPELSAYKNLFIRLFLNLIQNSIKYRSEAPPRIEVTAEEGPDGWTFCVADNGMGIPREYHEEVFVAFRRLHGYDEIEGTGIGLALCQKIVERHSGRIWVESEPGAGARFKFTIPN